MLYAAAYQKSFSSRSGELAHQRALADQLLWRALEQEYGVEAGSLQMARTPQGKPYFPGGAIHFSLSHCRGMVCCAVSRSPVMKLSGQGIAYGFQRASFTFGEQGPVFREQGVYLSQFALPGGYALSAASREERFRLVQVEDLG